MRSSSVHLQGGPAPICALLSAQAVAIVGHLGRGQLAHFVQYLDLLLDVVELRFDVAARCLRWVEYFDSCFWYCGIFLIICDRSFIDCFSLCVSRFDSVNDFRYCVTLCDTTAMCWWRRSTHRSSFSSSSTSFSAAFGDGMNLYTSFTIGSRSYAIACSVSSCSSGDTQSKPRSRMSSWERAFSGPSPIVGSSALYASSFCCTIWASSTLPSHSLEEIERVGKTSVKNG
uniref:Uncharacterized protein n=1 Tax=Anopheles atroparvus TaxID=41427 RepID=A0A182INX4_ANOAO